VAFVAQAMSPAMRSVAPSAQVVALDAVVLAVNSANRLDDLTLEQAAALFAGQRLDWSELGGNGGRPQLVSRIAGTVGRTLLEDKLMAGMAISSAALVMPHDRAARDYVAGRPAAVGHLSRSHIDEGIHALALGGIHASPENVRSGAYPLALQISVLVHQSAAGEATRFVAFATGAKGQALVSRRYIAVR
jgi:phosphate transport system substrate-binding protein